MSLATAIVILISCLIYFIAITGILCQKPERLEREQILKRFGYIYEELNYKKPEKARLALSLPIFIAARMFVMVIVIMRLDNNLVVQILIFCLMSIILMTIFGNAHPYTERAKSRLGMLTEFVILLVIDVLLCSSNPGLDVSARSYLGWTVIAILSLSMAYTQGSILIGNCKKTKLICKRAYNKRLVAKNNKKINR